MTERRGAADSETLLAHAAMLQTAKTLAMTGIDVALEPGLLDEIKREFGASGRGPQG